MKINLCCGMDYREGYLNVDFTDVGSDQSSIKIDLNHDILTGLPWEDDSVDELIFRESLEHFNRVQGHETLKEIYRVLKPGGTLDITVPNSIRQLKMLLMYSTRPIQLIEWLNPHCSPWGWGKYHEDLMGATHQHSKGDSHLTLYSANSIKMLVQAVGFSIFSFVEDSSFYIIARK